MSQNEPKPTNSAWYDQPVELVDSSYSNPYLDPYINVTNVTTHNITEPNVMIPDITGPLHYEPYIPPELKVCVVCGVDDVLIFCDACKEVIREARKQWARDFLEEIEDALS